MKIVVGLGNPGAQYRNTRHNVGFDVVDSLAGKLAFGQRAKEKFKANMYEVMIGTTKVVLLSPLTYMNLSGQSVRAAIDFYKLDLENLLVICDDLNLEPGRIRIRRKGSAGGQNGIKDIINRLGTNEFSRLRIGIGRPPAGWDTADYVLGKFDGDQKSFVERAVEDAATAVQFWVTDGVTDAMNRFNADPAAKDKKKKKPKDVPADSPTRVQADQDVERTNNNKTD